MDTDDDKFPRQHVLAGILAERGIGPRLWQINGPIDTDCRDLACYSWPAAKTVIIVQTYGKRWNRGKVAQDIEGWEIFAPVSRSNEIDETRADLHVYENCTPGEPTLTASRNGAEHPAATPTPKRPTLTEDDRRIICLGLRSSAEKWREWSLSIANRAPAESFSKQADRAERLAEYFEDAV